MRGEKPAFNAEQKDCAVIISARSTAAAVLLIFKRNNGFRIIRPINRDAIQETMYSQNIQTQTYFEYISYN